MHSYQFRAKAPNADIVLNGDGSGYLSLDENDAWEQLSHVLDRPIMNLKAGYTIERVP